MSSGRDSPVRVWGPVWIHHAGKQAARQHEGGGGGPAPVCYTAEFAGGWFRIWSGGLISWHLKAKPWLIDSQQTCQDFNPNKAASVFHVLLYKYKGERRKQAFSFNRKESMMWFNHIIVIHFAFNVSSSDLLCCDWCCSKSKNSWSRLSLAFFQRSLGLLRIGREHLHSPLSLDTKEEQRVPGCWWRIWAQF